MDFDSTLINNFALIRWNTKEISHLPMLLRTERKAKPKAKKLGIRIPPLQKQFYLETGKISDKQESQDVPNIE